MTLLQLKYFQYVCKYDSISKASIKLHVSQPAVSVAISNLEQEFGVSLFTRENHSLKITDAGKLLLTLTSELLAGVDTIYTKMAEYSSNSNVLRISTVPFAFSDKFQSVLHEFRAENPGIQVRIYEYDAQTAIQKLKSGQVDIAMGVDNGQKPSFVDGLIFSRSLSTFVVGANHPMASRKSCTMEELSHQSLIMTKEDSYITGKVKSYFENLGCEGNIFFYTASPSLISSMLQSGSDGAILSQLVSESIADCVTIPIEDPIPITHLLLWKHSEQLSTAKRLFIRKIQKMFPDTEKY